MPPLFEFTVLVIAWTRHLVTSRCFRQSLSPHLKLWTSPRGTYISFGALHIPALLSIPCLRPTCFPKPRRCTTAVAPSYPSLMLLFDLCCPFWPSCTTNWFPKVVHITSPTAMSMFFFGCSGRMPKLILATSFGFTIRTFLASTSALTLLGFLNHGRCSFGFWLHLCRYTLRNFSLCCLSNRTTLGTSSRVALFVH